MAQSSQTPQHATFDFRCTVPSITKKLKDSNSTESNTFLPFAPTFAPTPPQLATFEFSCPLPNTKMATSGSKPPPLSSAYLGPTAKSTTSRPSVVNLLRRSLFTLPQELQDAVFGLAYPSASVNYITRAEWKAREAKRWRDQRKNYTKRPFPPTLVDAFLISKAFFAAAASSWATNQHFEDGADFATGKSHVPQGIMASYAKTITIREWSSWRMPYFTGLRQLTVLITESMFECVDDILVWEDVLTAEHFQKVFTGHFRFAELQKLGPLVSIRLQAMPLLTAGITTADVWHRNIENFETYFQHCRACYLGRVHQGAGSLTSVRDVQDTPDAQQREAATTVQDTKQIGIDPGTIETNENFHYAPIDDTLIPGEPDTVVASSELAEENHEDDNQCAAPSQPTASSDNSQRVEGLSGRRRLGKGSWKRREFEVSRKITDTVRIGPHMVVRGVTPRLVLKLKFSAGGMIQVRDITSRPLVLPKDLARDESTASRGAEMPSDPCSLVVEPESILEVVRPYLDTKVRKGISYRVERQSSTHVHPGVGEVRRAEGRDINTDSTRGDWRMDNKPRAGGSQGSSAKVASGGSSINASTCSKRYGAGLDLIAPRRKTSKEWSPCLSSAVTMLTLMALSLVFWALNTGLALQSG
ncbi:hypothetical protein LTR56_012975 [Elasticomyces elasticus]|nr:hypothetical protein LTR56_012975 [Elasticomyces elasticus]KAK3667955.1 hypothetical protein LTR22_001022 [Elasticomyces elasticus]KAK4925105.1 hypothetical protein LTR49_007878 [Elasticomyces elasticus]KAK5767595.1 hypothetical protein LTS12_002096 [Elasticomyces elasticus]